MTTSHAAFSINSTSITNWNTAFGWGNHAGLYKAASWQPSWNDVTGKPNFATVATTGNYNDLINKPAPYSAGPGIAITGNTISANLSLQVSSTGDMLTLSPGNTVYVPGISSANSAVPIVTTKPISNISSTKAYASGNVLFYDTTMMVTETGICWSLNQPPTVLDYTKIAGVFDGDFICLLDSLTPNTMYFVRAYAKAGGNVYYGQPTLFTTTDILPIPNVTSTTAITGITETTALSGGFIASDGGLGVTARGVCWSTSPSPTVANSKTTNGTGTGLFSSYITGLTLNTLYYVRSYATNANGTNYGPELFFKTAGVLPTVTTAAPSSVTASSAVLGGNVTALGSSNVTQRGVCYSTSPNPTTADKFVSSGSGIGSFTTVLPILIPNTTYYTRAYATNSVGTSYGANQNFTTQNAYYEGFENGYPSNFSGIGWGVLAGTNAFEGFHCLAANMVGDSVQFTKTITSSPNGFISFYYSSDIQTGGTVTTNFYIDGVLQATLPGGGWTLHSYSIPAGTHTFKWVKGPNASVTHQARIDYIIVSP
jgi:hypothetical protein